MHETITAPVGAGGANRKQDVSIVQLLLNLASRERGIPKNQIEVDGIVGPITLAAIREFQQSYCRVVDGRVDPNQETITRLNHLSGHFQALNDGSSYLLPRTKSIRLS